LSAPLTIAILVNSPQRLQQLHALLSNDLYVLKDLGRTEELLQLVSNQKQEIDCLILEVDDQVLGLVAKLRYQGTILPVVFLADGQNDGTTPLYHASELTISQAQITDIEKLIELAIADFLALAPAPDQLASAIPDLKSISYLLQQQRRLSEKLKERLGYLAVYYNRNSERFFRNLLPEEQLTIYEQLKNLYREVVLAYFTPDKKINDMLDEFVTIVFCADLSVSEVVELHMDLMEDFSKQLKLEGWNEDILLDYRLTLIDVIAHLCEMYRRSVPRERHQSMTEQKTGRD
jgi:circadian clock protein KaiA